MCVEQLQPQGRVKAHTLQQGDDTALIAITHTHMHIHAQAHRHTHRAGAAAVSMATFPECTKKSFSRKDTVLQFIELREIGEERERRRERKKEGEKERERNSFKSL